MKLPQAAIDAARKGIRDMYGYTNRDGEIRCALAAAAPHIAAAEREQIAKIRDLCNGQMQGTTWARMILAILGEPDD